MSFLEAGKLQHEFIECQRVNADYTARLVDLLQEFKETVEKSPESLPYIRSRIETLRDDAVRNSIKALRIRARLMELRLEGFSVGAAIVPDYFPEGGL